MYANLPKNTRKYVGSSVPSHIVAKKPKKQAKFVKGMKAPPSVNQINGMVTVGIEESTPADRPMVEAAFRRTQQAMAPATA